MIVSHQFCHLLYMLRLLHPLIHRLRIAHHGLLPHCHLLRIIQEGVLQTTRRAGATCVEVSVTAASPWRLHVLIDGDGQGPAPGGLAGRSIASMHSRARELGTFLRVEDAARGMRIELKPSFPVSPSRPA